LNADERPVGGRASLNADERPVGGRASLGADERPVGARAGPPEELGGGADAANGSEDAAMHLEACATCGRKFNPVSMVKHAKVLPSLLLPLPMSLLYTPSLPPPIQRDRRAPP
jgi:hypothetical protein